jgi:hypothetical protein
VRAVDAAADAAGVDRDVAHLAFTDGPVAMIDAWFAMSTPRCSRASRPKRSPR